MSNETGVAVAEWLARPPAKQSVVQIRHPISAKTHMWGKQLAAMLAIYTSRGVTPEVNLRERISCMPPQSSNKAAHSGFETHRRRHQKSKTGVSVAPKMDTCPTKFFLKKSSHSGVQVNDCILTRNKHKTNKLDICYFSQSMPVHLPS